MTTFTVENKNELRRVFEIKSGIARFSGFSDEILDHYPNSSVLKTDGEPIECNVSGEVFQDFLKRVRESMGNQIKHLDVSQNGLNRMREAHKDPEKWEAFLDEHAPIIE